eukprot:4001870-Pyramimonas_sp.AAC.2
MQLELQKQVDLAREQAKHSEAQKAGIEKTLHAKLNEMEEVSDLASVSATERIVWRIGSQIRP